MDTAKETSVTKGPLGGFSDQMKEKFGRVDNLIHSGDITGALLTYAQEETGIVSFPISNQDFYTLMRRFADKVSVDSDIVNAVSQSRNSKLCISGDPVRNLLSCEVCGRLFEVPVTLPCENAAHTFCRNCLVTIAQCGAPACPTCHSGFSPLYVQKSNVSFAISRQIEGFFPHTSHVYKLKREGNECFASKDYHGALAKYDEAIRVGGPEATVLSNRSQVHLILGNSRECVIDADTAINLRPFWSKAYYRKALGLLADSDFKPAATVAFAMATLDKENLQIRDLFPKICWKYLVHLKGGRPDLADGSAGAMDISEDLCKKLEHCFQEAITFLKSKSDPADESVACSAEKAKLTTEIGTLIVEECLTCSLCYRLFYEPVTPPCGHSFCKQCLHRVLDFRPSCPQCRSDLSDYLATRRFGTTETLRKVCEVLFPNEYTERVRAFNNEMQTLAGITEDEVEIPVFVLQTAFPDIPLVLHIFEPRYRLMVRQAVESGAHRFGMASASVTEDPPFADYGTLVKIDHIDYEEDGRCFVYCRGEMRFRVLNRGMREGYHTARVKYIRDDPVSDDELAGVAAVHDEIYEMVKKVIDGIDPMDQTAENIGPFPAVGDLRSCSENGPAWIWWFGAFVDDLVPALSLELLKETNLLARLRIVKRVVSSLTNGILRSEVNG